MFLRGLLFGGSFAVPLRRARVEVPAVVVNCSIVAFGTGGALFAISDDLTDFRGGFFLETEKTHHHIGYLHAGVVDVVLHVDFVCR